MESAARELEGRRGGHSVGVPEGHLRGKFGPIARPRRGTCARDSGEQRATGERGCGCDELRSAGTCTMGRDTTGQGVAVRRRTLPARLCQPLNTPRQPHGKDVLCRSLNTRLRDLRIRCGNPIKCICLPVSSSYTTRCAIASSQTIARYLPRYVDENTSHRPSPSTPPPQSSNSSPPRNAFSASSTLNVSRSVSRTLFSHARSPFRFFSCTLLRSSSSFACSAFSRASRSSLVLSSDGRARPPGIVAPGPVCTGVYRVGVGVGRVERYGKLPARGPVGIAGAAGGGVADDAIQGRRPACVGIVALGECAPARGVEVR